VKGLLRRDRWYANSLGSGSLRTCPLASGSGLDGHGNPRRSLAVCHCRGVVGAVFSKRARDFGDTCGWVSWDGSLALCQLHSGHADGGSFVLSGRVHLDDPQTVWCGPAQRFQAIIRLISVVSLLWRHCQKARPAALYVVADANRNQFRGLAFFDHRNDVAQVLFQITR